MFSFEFQSNMCLHFKLLDKFRQQLNIKNPMLKTLWNKTHSLQLLLTSTLSKNLINILKATSFCVLISRNNFHATDGVCWKKNSYATSFKANVLLFIIALLASKVSVMLIIFGIVMTFFSFCFDKWNRNFIMFCTTASLFLNMYIHLFNVVYKWK